MMRESEPDVAKEELVARCRNVLGENMEIEISVTDRTNFRAKFKPVTSKLTAAEEPRGQDIDQVP